MVTVEHVDEVGWETLKSFVSTSFDHKKKELIGLSGGDVTYASGHAYVMNEHGKTVGVYNMDKKQEKNHGAE